MNVLAFVGFVGVREQNSVRIATEVFILAAVVLIAAYRFYRVRKDRRRQPFFDEMSRTTHRDPPPSN